MHTFGRALFHLGAVCKNVRLVPTFITLAILVGFVARPSAFAQDPTGVDREFLLAERNINLFLDCDVCDFNYIRREVAFVNHVRDRETADVHALVTYEGTASGGRRYTFDLIGQGVFDEQEYSVSATTLASDSEDEERIKLVRALKAALSPFLLQTPLAERMSVEVEADGEEAGAPPENDPWNGWTFEFYADGSGDVESTQYSLHVRYGVYVDRVTEQWKIRIRPYFNYNADKFEDDGETIRSDSRRDGLDTYAIRSINSHWSVGVFADAFSSTFSNIELRLRASPAIEFSVFPYREASTRELTVAYYAGLSHVQYRDTTIFGKISEVLPQHVMDLNYELRRRWGTIDVGVEASQYLHDLDKYNVEIDGGVSLRLTRGLSLRVGGEVELIHDLLNLARGDASLEEVLLRRRQLATSFRVEGSIGFRYRFGSIYNNVVNTRF